MKKNKATDFNKERERLNEIVMKYANTGIKRFYNLDWNAYQAGALDCKTKELLGLTASLVLRCDDCISYHMIQCHKSGISSEEIVEALNIGLIVGGSITIPHLRRALDLWDKIV
ncbi:MAG: carboxymuconolactone decarboxylase family protein [Candidatus Wallbacteria bacterium]|nr:carboxymuconolactone decarboxylase family protein [Candidatus Wallbacteria bacterium]